MELIPSQVRVSAVFPNPLVDIATVNIESLKPGKATIIITDASGKSIMSKAIQLSKGLNKVQFAAGNLPANTYILKIISANGRENVMKKFVRQ